MQGTKTPVRRESPTAGTYDGYSAQYYPQVAPPSLYGNGLQSPFSVSSRGDASASSPAVGYYGGSTPQLASQSAPHLPPLPHAPVAHPHSPQAYHPYLPYSPQFSASQTSITSARSYGSPQLPRAASPARTAPVPHGGASPTRTRDASPQRSIAREPAREPLRASRSQSSLTPRSEDMERHPERLTAATREKAAVTKLKVEHFFKLNVNHAIERNQRRVKTEQLIASEKGSDEWRDRQLAQLGRKESAFLRLRRTKLGLDDFITVKVIGKGAFGEVRLVQKRDTGQVFAMKTLYKSEMFKKDQLAHVKAERDVLAGSDSPWVVSLYYSFQDDDYLYLIMEFLPGGDLMTMLIKYDIFSEDITRFYIAECVLAIEAIHKLGFIHRDIKPDNILIDKSGHIKLSDFGLSTGFHKTHDSAYYKQLLDKEPARPDAIQLTISNRQQILTWRKSRRLMAYSTVGTPDYIAPEIFIRKGYSQECDWWSLGAIMFECLVGWPPFCSETPQETYRKILNWKETLSFPDDIHLSPESEDLIRRLLTSQENRLGRGGADEIKQHPFFRGVDWSQIREYSAPFVPRLKSIMDTSYFPTEDLQQVPDPPRDSKSKNKPKNAREDLPFIGYTFSRFDYLTKKNAI